VRSLKKTRLGLCFKKQKPLTVFVFWHSLAYPYHDIGYPFPCSRNLCNRRLVFLNIFYNLHNFAIQFFQPLKEKGKRKKKKEDYF